MNIEIIYEDEDLLVLNKPAGTIVNRSETTIGQITVQDWIENKIKDQRSKIKKRSRIFIKGQVSCIELIKKHRDY